MLRTNIQYLCYCHFERNRDHILVCNRADNAENVLSLNDFSLNPRGCTENNESRENSRGKVEIE